MARKHAGGAGSKALPPELHELPFVTIAALLGPRLGGLRCGAETHGPLCSGKLAVAAAKTGRATGLQSRRVCVGATRGPVEESGGVFGQRELERRPEMALCAENFSASDRPSDTRHHHPIRPSARNPHAP